MRFLADAGVSPRIVEWLRSGGHDVVHLSEQGLQRLPDQHVFEKAAAEQRTVLTFDLDFGEIVALLGVAHTSVVVFRLRDPSIQHVIERLGIVLEHAASALSGGAIVTVEDARHRIRRLPIRAEPG